MLLASLVLVVRLVPPVAMVVQVPLVTQDLQARMGLPDPLVVLVLLEVQDLLESEVSPAHQEKKGPQAHEEKGGHRVSQVLKASSAAGETRVCQACVAPAAHPGWQGPRVKMVNQAPTASQENAVLLVPKVLLDKEAYLESLAEMATRAPMACLDVTDPQEAKVTVVKVALLALQDPLATLDLQVLLVHLEKLVKEDFRVPLALLALLVLLVFVVLPVLKVLEVIKVNLVNEAALA